MMCGGVGEARAADADVQKIVDKVKHAVLSKVNKQPEVFKAIEYATQVVAGTNYFVKVHFGNDEYAHLRVFVPLPCHGSEPELHGLKHPVAKEDKLSYIEKI